MIQQRSSSLIEHGILPMSGEIKKCTRFVNGNPLSYISVNLDHVLPSDIEDVIEKIRSESASVENDYRAISKTTL